MRLYVSRDFDRHTVGADADPQPISVDQELHQSRQRSRELACVVSRPQGSSLHKKSCPDQTAFSGLSKICISHGCRRRGQRNAKFRRCSRLKHVNAHVPARAEAWSLKGSGSTSLSQDSLFQREELHASAISGHLTACCGTSSMTSCKARKQSRI